MKIDFSLKNNLKYLFDKFIIKKLVVFFAENGLLVGIFLLLIMFVFVVITFPFILIGFFFSWLNETSKNFFRNKVSTQ